MHRSRDFVRKVCLMQQFEVGRRKKRDECEARGGFPSTWARKLGLGERRGRKGPLQGNWAIR